MAENQKTILIAEDEDDLREMYSMALSSKGFEVLAAANGNEAIEWLEKQAPDVDIILMDIVMPGMDGFEALEKIKKNEQWGKIPVLVSTNLDNDDDRSQALGMGAKDYFVKSRHTPAELVEKIKEVLEKRSMA